MGANSIIAKTIENTVVGFVTGKWSWMYSVMESIVSSVGLDVKEALEKHPRLQHPYTDFGLF